MPAVRVLQIFKRQHAKLTNAFMKRQIFHSNNAAKPTNPPSNQQGKQPNQITLCFPQALSILGLHCGGGAAPSPFTYHPSVRPSVHASINGVPANQPTKQQRGQANQPFEMLSILVLHCGEALRPPLPPARIYLHSIHLCIHACIHPHPPIFTEHPSIHPSKKEATNKPSNQSHTTQCFPQMLSILRLHCGGGRSALPRTPSRLYLHSIHPPIHRSINQAHKQEELHIHQALHHASNQQQANQPTNAPKSNMFLPVHDPSITICAFPKSKQPTNQFREVIDADETCGKPMKILYGTFS